MTLTCDTAPKKENPMPLDIHIIDAFTDTVFKGNSAAVIILNQWLEDSVMQSIASQNNLSETAFLVKNETDLEGKATLDYHIRWFSPLKEMDFCGHATLASAFLLFEQHSTATSIHFYAKAVGSLIIQKTPEGKIRMNFPNTLPSLIYSATHELAADVDPVINTVLAHLPNAAYKIYKNHQAYFIMFDNEAAVLGFEPDTMLMTQLAPLGLVLTAQAQSNKYSKYDFISRYFSQALGGAEDPVTGSVHTALAPLWGKQLSKDQLLAYQASSRGGELQCELQGDRVLISGHAVRYLSGVIEI